MAAMLDWRRFWRHVLMTPGKAARAFPAAAMEAIQRAIKEHEARHRGEVVFVVEAELTTAQLWGDLSSRARAREVFARQGVWNTEENNGVLIYVLLADHRVEIVADRGVDRHVSAEEWSAIARLIETHFHEGRFEQGAVAAVTAVSQLLARYFPAGDEGRNELEDRPLLI